jgi:membrane fusion protein (multidrug efflux system)
MIEPDAQSSGASGLNCFILPHFSCRFTTQAARRAAEETCRQALAQVNSGLEQIGAALGRLAEASARPQRIEVSRTEVATAGADIAAARAALQQAELNLSYTKIHAPESGHVTRKNVDEGQLLQPGQVVMAIVYGEVWVVANFKETQLREMHVGQPVEIKVDACPDRHFKGHVDSFQYGTGARFSLLPPENATGNFVKVVQRVPVKIVFDEQPDLQHPLVPGMSVEPEVNVGARPTPPNRGQPKGASPNPQTSASPGSPPTPSARPVEHPLKLPARRFITTNYSSPAALSKASRCHSTCAARRAIRRCTSA